MATANVAVDLGLAEDISRFYADPLGFVMYAYPWGEPGRSLENETGPDEWQREALISIGNEVKRNKFDGQNPVMPIRRAWSSGHGIGKSTLVGWLVNWIMSTRPHCRGTVTANKWDQLRDKTWAAVKKWTALCITAHWFVINDTRMYHAANRDTWFCAPSNSKEEHSESFAGQHAKDSTSFYVFDEDSGIPDIIHQVAEGGLTDGEPMIFLLGNPTKNSGHFHRACFGSERDRWNAQTIDSRTSRFSNKALIAEWEQVYGPDSDYFRVRVLGMPPRASELQFIDQGRVDEAKRRALPPSFGDEPLIAGVDVSDGGSAWCVVRFRQGANARIPPIRVPGEKVRGDRGVFLAKLADVLSDGVRVDGAVMPVAQMFVDSAFGAPYVERLQAMGYRNVQEVRFGSESLDSHQANRRAFMWHATKEWLGGTGCIDPKDERLELDLVGPGYHINKADKLVIESKEDMAKRGVASPDDGDALALTFAAPVQKPRKQQRMAPPAAFTWS